jgi:YNFM family putative membrane transporter
VIAAPAVRRSGLPVAVAAAGVATFLNLYTPQAILPALSAAFGVRPTDTGLAVTASLLAVALVAPFAGAVSDALGRRRLIVGAAAAVIVPTLLVATAPSFSALLAWRFVQGLLLPFIFTVTVAYIGDECRGAEAIRAAGVYASGSVAGGFAGRFIAGLAADFAGWRVGFAAAAAVTAGAAAVIALTLPKERNFRPVRGGVSAMLRGWREHALNPLLWGCCAVGAGMLFSMVATFTFVNLRLAAPPFGLSPGALGSVFAVYLVGVVTTPLATRAAVHIGRARTAVLGAGVAVAGQLLTLAPSLPLIVAGLMATCAGLFVAQALALGYIGVAVQQARSSAVGLYVAVYYAGGALGAVLPAPLWHRAGWAGCVALVSAAIAGMAVAAQLTFRDRTATTSA